MTDCVGVTCEELLEEMGETESVVETELSYIQYQHSQRDTQTHLQCECRRETLAT